MFCIHRSHPLFSRGWGTTDKLPGFNSQAESRTRSSRPFEFRLAARRIFDWNVKTSTWTKLRYNRVLGLVLVGGFVHVMKFEGSGSADLAVELDDPGPVRRHRHFWGSSVTFLRSVPPSGGGEKLGGKIKRGITQSLCLTIFWEHCVAITFVILLAMV